MDPLIRASYPTDSQEMSSESVEEIQREDERKWKMIVVSGVGRLR